MKPNDKVKDVETGDVGTITSAWIDDEDMLNIIVAFDHKEGDTVYWACSNGCEHRKAISGLEVLQSQP